MTVLDDIRKAYNNLKAEIDAIDAEAAPIIAAGKKLQASLEALRAEQVALNEQLAQYRDQSYLEKRKLLGQLAVSLNGKRLIAEPMKLQGPPKADFRP